MAFTHRFSAFLFTLAIVIAVSDKSLADKDYSAKRAAAEHFLATSPNAVGVWEADEYGTLVHIPSGFRCSPGQEGEVLKLIQLNTAGSPIGNEVSCKWDMVRDGGELSTTVRRYSEITPKSELIRNLSELKAKHSATHDGVPMSMGGQPPFELESARLRFVDSQNRQMQISQWMYFANGWVVSTRAVYPVEDEQGLRPIEFLAATQAFGGAAHILKIDGPIRLVTDDK